MWCVQTAANFVFLVGFYSSFHSKSFECSLQLRCCSWVVVDVLEVSLVGSWLAVSQGGYSCHRTLHSLGISQCKAALISGACGCCQLGWLSPGCWLSRTLQAQGDELQLAASGKSDTAGQLLAAQPVQEQSVQIHPTQIKLFWNKPFFEKGF